MTDLRKAAEMALKRLDMYFVEHGNDDDFYALQALRQALAQPSDSVEQEPVAFVNGYFGGYLTITCFDSTLVLPDGLTLYTAPPQKEWVGLSDEEIMDRWPCETRIEFARWVEAKLKEKNSG